MLVNFTFKNFKSFRNEMALSIEVSSIQKLSDAVKFCEGELLPLTIMYSANSSAKSNVLKALKAIRDVLLHSVKLNPKDSLEAEPFSLDITSGYEPASFEIQLTFNNSKFRYGFYYNTETRRLLLR